MLDQWDIAILCVAAIWWSILGVMAGIELYPFAPTWRWKAFIIAAAGPAIWGIALWRGLKALRLNILRRYGVEHCTCCHDPSRHR